MSIPDFPNARPLALDDKPWFDRLLAEAQPEVSQYTFTNIFAWRKARSTRVAQSRGLVLVSLELTDRKVLLEPMGEGDKREAMEECLRHPWGKSVEFRYLPWNTAALFQGDPVYDILTDRDNSDYLYAARDLIDLAGRKYDAKRNFIRRFTAEHKYRYLELTSELVAECRKFEEHWCRDRSCQSDEGLSHEQEAIAEMLDHFRDLGIRGGALEVDGSIVAFALGEAFNRETLVVHVEKADAKLAGVYAVINNEFCRHGAEQFKYVNREQDLGVPGLRQAKQSYHPIRLVETFRLRLH